MAAPGMHDGLLTIEESRISEAFFWPPFPSEA